MSLAELNLLQPSWQFPEDASGQHLDGFEDDIFHFTDTSTQDQSIDNYLYLQTAESTSQQQAEPERQLLQYSQSQPNTGTAVNWFPLDNLASIVDSDDDVASDDDLSFSENETQCLHELLPKRNLRAHRGEGLSQFSNTWLDKDETGNYDPAESRRQPRRKRRRITKGDDTHNITCDRAPKNDTDSIPSIVSVLKFRIVEKKLAFAKLSSHLALVEKTASNEAERILRTSARERRYHKLNREQDLPDDLIGHPERRGCYECASLGERCSMLDNEREWPCNTCGETGEECELIIPPVRKLACQFCEKNRTQCSFTFCREQGETCHACIQRGFRCVAGPDKEFVQPRISYDRDWKLNPLPEKKIVKGWVTCLECREAKRPCNPSSKDADSSPCAACKQHNLPCIIGRHPSSYMIPEAGLSRPKLNQSQSSNTATNESATIHFPQSPAYSPDSNTITIHTSFAHPVEFNAADASSSDCHFCSVPSFAIVGFGRKHVSVMDTDDNSAWIETSGGHRAAGEVEKTRLCVLCTTRRLQIIMCENHDVRQISTVAPSHEEQEMAIEKLMSGEDDEQVPDLDIFCSLCPSLANYECEGGGVGEGDGGATGCGLKLCERCMLVLMGTHGGKLNEMLTEVNYETSDGRPLGFRADVEFLCHDGALLKYFSYISKQ